MHTNNGINIQPRPIGVVPVPIQPRLFPGYWLAIGAMTLGLSPSLLASPVNMVFNGVNGAQVFGEYVGPYSGTMNQTPVDLFCVDFGNQVTFGQKWDANLTGITTGEDLGATRFGSEPDAMMLYQEAAWLALQFELQDVGQFGDIHATIWQLFNSTAPLPSSSWWAVQAAANYTSADFSDFRIVTNTGPVERSGQVQEFLTRVPSEGVPEPTTQLLVGLTLICGARRWRWVQARSRALSVCPAGIEQTRSAGRF